MIAARTQQPVRPVYLRYRLTHAEAHAIRLRVEEARESGVMGTTGEIERAWLLAPPVLDVDAIRDVITVLSGPIRLPVKRPQGRPVADVEGHVREVTGCLMLSPAEARLVDVRAKALGVDRSHLVRCQLLGLGLHTLRRDRSTAANRLALRSLLVYAEQAAERSAGVGVGV